MPNDGCGCWTWLASFFITPVPVPTRTAPVRHNTISKAPPYHFTQAVSYDSASGPLLVSSRPRKEIKFYKKGESYYEFTNFARYDVIHKGKRYPTSEHLFQALKFLEHHPQIAERIRSCNGPRKVFDLAHKYQRYVRDDWRQVNVDKMRTVLRLKFTQHQKLKDLLLGTGDNHLVEDSPTDYWWGIGADRSGQNQLGKLLEELRDELRQDVDPSYQPLKREPRRCPSWPNPLSSNFRTAGLSTSRTDPRVLKTRVPKDGLGSNVCELCRQRPKNLPHAFCGNACSKAHETAAKYASLCENCHARPKQGGHPYCGRTCAAAARAQATRAQY